MFGIPVPDKLKNRPELKIGLEMYMTAFYRLSTCRQVGMGVGPIPWNFIAEYARMQELDQDHTDALFYHIEAMDSVFLKWSARETKPSDAKDRHSDQ